MNASPLSAQVVFTLGPVVVTQPVVTTWVLMLVLGVGGWLAGRGLKLRPSRAQAVFELVVGAIQGQIRDTLHAAATPYLPLLGTIFLFILTANWSSLVPGVEPPTAHIETDAALALIVFIAVIWFGVRAQGLGGYLKTFAQPAFVMIPLNVLSTLARTLAMVVRLFGNVMSGVFIIGVVLSLAGLIVPIPLMALDLLTGAVQAYIFTVLAMVFIGSAISGGEGDAAANETQSEAGT